MIFDKIGLLDPEYGTVKKTSKIRKIKFKSLSFKNISNLWKNFRVNLLNRKLEKAKEKLVETNVEPRDLERKAFMSEMSVAEKKIYKKAAAVVRLEEKINYLETGTKVTDDFIASRAIKLKDSMMKNLRFNCGTAYSVPTDSYGKIFEMKDMESSEVVSSSEEEVRKKTAENVQKIMEKMKVEKQKNNSVATEPQQVEATTEPIVSDESSEISAPSRDEIKKAVDKMFEEHQEAMEENETQSKGTENLNQVESMQIISEDEVEEVVQEKLDEIKVIKNEASVAKVNKFVNEDGSYSLKREDMDEDFRITKSESPLTLVDIAMKKAQEGLIPEIIRQRDTQFNIPNIVDNNSEESVEDVSEQEVVERTPLIVAPERELTPTEEIKMLSEAVDVMETKEDVQKVLDSIEDLKVRQEASRSKAQAVALAREELEAERSAVIQELLDYRAALREDCDTTATRIEVQQAENDALADEIQTMRDALRRAK